ncbi:hypothetical protein FRC03_007322 [Tulasnella sp. 419]|nr:hypothetical protein FRC03_007322 [Tulasnella sp. 419]
MQGTTFPDRWKWIWNIDVQSTRKASPKEFIWTIASFLEVKDLLALTYCSPQSRAELTSPIYEPVWQKALNRFREEQPSRCVPLPECPPYMECWKFADLALTRRCKHCHKAISAIVMYRLPTKLCRACFAANIVPQRFVVEEILGPEERFPFSVLQGVTSILAEEACEPSYQGLYYYSPFILYYIEQYRALCRAHESFNVEDTGPRNEWVRNCKKRVRERNRIGRELVNWDLDNRQYNENYNTLFLTMGERPTPPERDEDSIL